MCRREEGIDQRGTRPAGSAAKKPRVAWTKARMRELLVAARTRTSAEISAEWGISQAWVKRRIIAAQWLVEHGKLRVD